MRTSLRIKCGFLLAAGLLAFAANAQTVNVDASRDVLQSPFELNKAGLRVAMIHDNPWLRNVDHPPRQTRSAINEWRIGTDDAKADWSVGVAGIESFARRAYGGFTETYLFKDFRSGNAQQAISLGFRIFFRRAESPGGW
jgi:hypothetical protein